MPKNIWTRNELILAFNLYCKTPFPKINTSYKPIQDLSEIIGRSPSAVAFKLANFARLDPELKKRKIKGLRHGNKQEFVIWNEFRENWDELSFLSESLLANYKNESIESSAAIQTYDLPAEGKEREALIKIRVNQNFFRCMVLSSYQGTCCITGLNITPLLVGAHIVPWGMDKNIRMNPENGLCLNLLHEKAFDRGLLTITNDYRVLLSSKLLKNSIDETVHTFFTRYQGKEIIRPHRFLPNENYLSYHYENIFIK